MAQKGNDIYAGTEGQGVYKSTNNGLNWNQTPLNNKGIEALYINGNNIYAGGNGFYLSTNDGASWTTINPQINTQYFAVNGTTMFAGNSGGLYKSTNNGISWTLTGFSGLNVTNLFAEGGNIFACVMNFGIYLSTNNGITWLNKNQGLSSIQAGPVLILNNYLFLGTMEYSVWKRLYSETISVNNISTTIPNKYFLYQNYPNPFNPATTIKYDIPRDVFVTISIFDLLGRGIMKIVNEYKKPGNYSVSFDGSNLPSGIYFYSLKAGNIIQTKKMVLIK
jgi:hypothetical protein